MDTSELSHEELHELSISTLDRILSTDPLMSGLPGDITLDEIKAQTAVATGQFITLQILRDAEVPLNVMIPQAGATVLDLKKAIKRSFELQQKRTKNFTKISWRYIWKTYWLQFGDVFLANDAMIINNYGIVNKSQLKFAKKLKRNAPLIESYLH